MGKIYLSEQTKLFEDIVNNREIVTRNNFSSQYQDLRNSQKTKEQKYAISRSLLEVFSAFTSTNFRQQDFSQFNNAPHQFNRCLMSHSSHLIAMHYLKDIQNEVNEFFSDYLRALYLLDFINKEYKNLTIDYNELKKTYSKLINERNSGEIEPLVEDPIFGDSPLPEKKVVPENQEEIGGFSDTDG